MAKVQPGRSYRIRQVRDNLALVEEKTGRVVLYLSEMSVSVDLSMNRVATVEAVFAIVEGPEV